LPKKLLKKSNKPNMPKVTAPNQQYLDSIKSLGLGEIISEPIPTPVESEPQAVSDQSRSLPNMVEEENTTVNKHINMLTTSSIDYTAEREKVKKEEMILVGFRIPKPLKKLVDTMMYDINVLQDQDISTQEIYTRAIALYLKNEGYYK
jgi:hypothetical protein